jgi:hypothetical protein
VTLYVHKHVYTMSVLERKEQTPLRNVSMGVPWCQVTVLIINKHSEGGKEDVVCMRMVICARVVYYHRTTTDSHCPEAQHARKDVHRRGDVTGSNKLLVMVVIRRRRR